MIAELGSTGNSREPGLAVWGDGEARSTDETGQCRWREGASVAKETQEATKTEGLTMSPVTPASVQKLQTALHAKAKESPNFRFYAVYDKVYRKDVLTHAYECCQANGGAAGVMVRGSRTSKRMESSDGWTNWRKS